MVIGSVHKSWRSIVPVVVVLATGLLSCRGSDANPDTTEMVAEAVEGECRDVFGSQVCTWASIRCTKPAKGSTNSKRRRSGSNA